MNSTETQAASGAAIQSPAHVVWIVFEPDEVIELKRIVLDHATASAVDLFGKAIVPRLRAAVRERGVALDLLAKAGSDDGLPG